VEVLELRDMGREVTGTAAPLGAKDGAVTVPAPDRGEAPPATVLAMAAVGAAAIAQGAYHFTGQVLTGVLLGAAVVVALAGRRLGLADLRFWPVAGCAALGLWAATSAAGAGVPLSAAGPTVMLLAALVVVGVLCRQGGDEVVVGLLLLGGLVAISGLAGVAFRYEPWTLEDQGLWRAATTLTYANAAAGLLVPLVLLAAGRLISTARSGSLAALTSLLLAGAGATLSRGGLLALALGGVLLARAVGPRRLVAAAAGPVAGALVVLGGLAPSMVVGRSPRPLLAVAGLAAGLGLAAVLAARPRVAAAAIVGASLLVAGAAALAGGLDAARVSRMTVSSPDRAAEASAAVRVAADHPLAGAGPGQVILSWHDDEGRRLVAHYAHNEYLQTWAELGAIGVALVLVLAASVVREVRRAAPPLPVQAAAGAGLAAVALHSGMDFLWHIPAIPLVCAALVAVACPPRTGAIR
jgi:O-antigen ligase